MITPVYDDGEWEIRDADGRLTVIAFNQGGYDSTEVYIDEILSALTDEQRMQLFSAFCRGCGKKDPRCPCQNDE